MSQAVKSFIGRFTTTTAAEEPEGVVTAPKDKLFSKTDPVIDGEDCLHDCESCSVKYPPKFSIDEEDDLYGNVNGWDTHLVVATGKTDWVRDVSDEPGSIMEAVEKGGVAPSNGTMKLSASNMPQQDSTGTRVLILPAFTYVDHVTPASVPTLITEHINRSSTNSSPLPPPTASTTPSTSPVYNDMPSSDALPPTPLLSSPCPHRYLILLCSQKTRDARCGQSAPLLRKELERHLRPLGLYRDLRDERPGGCGIYFISHVGGHKYSANVIVYRRAADGGEAAQCIWLARVKPQDCENIVRYTLLQGKVVKPQRQLRGGFDRTKGLVSWEVGEKTPP